MCSAPFHQIPPRSYRCSAQAKPCAGNTSRSSPRRRADGTLPRRFAGSEPGDRHRAERVLRTRRRRSNGAGIGRIARRTYDYFLYVVSTLPLRSTRVCRRQSPLSLLRITMILRVRRKILKLLRSPTVGVDGLILSSKPSAVIALDGLKPYYCNKFSFRHSM